MNRSQKASKKIGGRARGFALAAVIVCLVLVSVALIGVARASLRAASETARSKMDLQLRWGARSCQKAVLALAPELFDRLEERHRTEDRAGPAPSRRSYRFTLNGDEYRVTLSDASATFDVNTAFHYVGRNRLETSLRRLLNGQDMRFLRLQPSGRSLGKPDLEEEVPEFPEAFSGWGQVFRLELLASAGSRSHLVRMTGPVTLYARGGLNVRRASDAVFQGTCELVVSGSQAKKIVERCREHPRLSIRRVVEQVGIERRDQVYLKSLLSDQSSCYRVWVEVQGAGKRSLTSAVLRYGSDGSNEVLSHCY